MKLLVLNEGMCRAQSGMAFPLCPMSNRGDLGSNDYINIDFSIARVENTQAVPGRHNKG